MLYCRQTSKDQCVLQQRNKSTFPSLAPMCELFFRASVKFNNSTPHELFVSISSSFASAFSFYFIPKPNFLYLHEFEGFEDGNVYRFNWWVWHGDLRRFEFQGSDRFDPITNVRLPDLINQQDPPDCDALFISELADFNWWHRSTKLWMTSPESSL